MQKILAIVLTMLATSAQAQFKAEQLTYKRVKEAKAEKDATLKALFEDKDFAYPPKELFFRTFKQENIFEMWAKDTKTGKFVLVKSYEVCAMSGEVGPKRKQGDLQVPEGFYKIDYYNPNSNFHLSVRINYPNQSDRKLSAYPNDLGGDIFIHGACASIGCISITDDLIKEVYWLMVQAKDGGQANIPVHIFPAKLTDEKWKELKEEYKDDKTKITFWENIREGYLLFEKNKTLPKVTVNAQGKYVFQ